MNTVSGELKIENGPNIAAGLDIPLPTGVTLEIFYNRLDSELRFRGSRSGLVTDTTFFQMSTNYIQIGGLSEFETGTNLKPFGVLAVGTTVFSPKSNQHSDEWLFSISLGAGLKYYLSERIGLRLDGRFLFPLYLTGGGFFCGTGGCGAGIGSSPIVLQGFIDGGVILRLGQ